MANRKISDLTALTAPVAGDLLPIVDISEAAAADKNKKITYGTFLSSVPLGTAAAPSIAFTGDTNTGIYSPGADQLAIATAGTGQVFVNGSGNLGLGVVPSNWNQGTNIDIGAASCIGNNGNLTQISNNRVLTSGVNYYKITAAASIYSTGAGQHIWYNAPSGAAGAAITFTERMRITNAGDMYFAKNNDVFTNKGIVFNSYGTARISTDSTSADEVLLYLNRQNSDGNLVRFYQANTEEGSISVSGTTVSYNGAHLSRWSQLPSSTERTEILRGSVLSNIDEMCEWGNEENEQLNRMRVSDIEGDRNVSGVFQAWDDDDDTYTNDFYCAMTGDFIIRIAEGVTVGRGDLLMSAGDGTAKPQDDDIIRSKTIAKVTSTNVSCTYEDGSYCVPCVLMAC